MNVECRKICSEYIFPVKSMLHNLFLKNYAIWYKLKVIRQTNAKSEQMPQNSKNSRVFDTITTSWQQKNTNRMTWNFPEVFYWTKFLSLQMLYLINKCFPPFPADGLSMLWSMNWNSVPEICQPRTCTRCPLVKWSSFCWIFFNHSSRGGNEMCGVRVTCPHS